jgi:hypothetical protein
VDRIPFDPGIDFCIDLAPDGERIALLGQPNEIVTGSLHVAFMLNFFDELRRPRSAASALT